MPLKSGAFALNEGHISLLTKVVQRASVSLTIEDWKAIAEETGSNAAATKERFRYMMAKIKESGESKTNVDNDAPTPTTPKTPKTPKTPRKRAAGGASGKKSSAKKPKVEVHEDEDITGGDDIADIKPEVNAENEDEA